MNIELVDSNNSYNQMEQEECVLEGRWWIRVENVIAHIEDRGSWVRDLIQSLLEFDHNEAVVQVGQFAIDLVDGLSLVQAECNNNNAAIVQEALPIMLRQLVQIVSRNFISDVIRIANASTSS